MSKDLPASVRAELEASQLKPITIYELFFTNTEIGRYAEYDKDISFAGLTYSAVPIQYEAIETSTEGEVGNVRVTIANANRAIGLLTEQYAGLSGCLVKIRSVFADHLGDTSMIVERFWGYVSSVRFPDAISCSIEVTGALDLDNVVVPRRYYQREFCSFVFKNADTCKYAGALTTCKKTIEDCITRGNVQNFGGFPLIPQDVTIRL